jgi:hypothetical protein
MITYTGDSIWPRGSEHDKGEAPSLYSIGVGLGRTARFAGQTKLFYTVLMHTFQVVGTSPTVASGASCSRAYACADGGTSAATVRHPPVTEQATVVLERSCQRCGDPEYRVGVDCAR